MLTANGVGTHESIEFTGNLGEDEEVWDGKMGYDENEDVRG